MAILAILATMTVGADSDNYQVIRGKLTSYNFTKDALGTFKGVSVRHDKGTIVLRIDEKTKLEKVKDGKVGPCTIDEIAAATPGGYVEADCDLVVFASNPPTTTAFRLRLLEKREP
jgi:hypothetical protein